MAKFIDSQPFKCLALKKPKQKKEGFKKPDKQQTNKIDCEYNFDVTIVGKTFNKLLGAGQFKLLEDHKLPSPEKIARKQYCKWHNS